MTVPSSDTSAAQAPQKRVAQAQPYRHGSGYAIRRRYQGNDIFLSGFKTAAAAQKAMTARTRAIDNHAKPVGAGALRTTFAQAMQDYALSKLPHLKGAAQEARRINTYLRAAGLSLLSVKKVEKTENLAGKIGRGAFFEITLVSHTTERVIPPGLGSHRKALLNANAGTDKLRAILAQTCVGKITRDQIQRLVNQMSKENNAPSTVALERAMLRVVLNHAFVVWGWDELQDNPATRLKMPQIDNERTRVLDFDEQALLDEALADCRNALVVPTLELLRETAMRVSEPLEHATWGDVDWTKNLLRLGDGKAGSRFVPLSPVAIKALMALGPGEAKEPLVQISYEALRAAWQRACVRAGIEDLNIHDLRHTAATRMALQTGNVFLVKALTGHKTLKMLERYVNVSPEDVVKVMHASPDAASEVPPSVAQDVPSFKRPQGRPHLRLVA